MERRWLSNGEALAFQWKGVDISMECQRLFNGMLKLLIIKLLCTDLPACFYFVGVMTKWNVMSPKGMRYFSNGR